MIDPLSRHAIRMRVQRRRALVAHIGDLFSRAAGSLSRATGSLSRATQRAAASPSRFKVGDYVAGDDPFNGCQEGVVAVINGTSVGLRTTAGAGGAAPSGTVVYYDYRQLRKPW